MSHKRKLPSEMDLYHQMKKRKVTNESTTLSKDEQQYIRIFNNIKSSGLIHQNNVHANLIQIISKFATGSLVYCYKCHQSMSFLEIECENKTSLKCLACKTRNWCMDCNVHLKKCTGTRCSSCSDILCYDLSRKCMQCGGIMCAKCFPQQLNGTTCWDCTIHNDFNLY